MPEAGGILLPRPRRHRGCRRTRTLSPYGPAAQPATTYTRPGAMQGKARSFTCQDTLPIGLQHSRGKGPGRSGPWRGQDSTHQSLDAAVIDQAQPLHPDIRRCGGNPPLVGREHVQRLSVVLVPVECRAGLRPPDVGLYRGCPVSGREPPVARLVRLMGPQRRRMVERRREMNRGVAPVEQDGPVLMMPVGVTDPGIE